MHLRLEKRSKNSTQCTNQHSHIQGQPKCSNSRTAITLRNILPAENQS